MRVVIGVMVYNEGANLDFLLRRLHATELANGTLERIVVVSSASTDDSDVIARRWSEIDPRIELVVQPERRGKAHAINEFLCGLDQGVDVCVFIGGDLLPAAGSIDALIKPFQDETVGMAGARPVPTNPRKGLVNRASHLLWSLHHRVAMRTPKLGEMVAIRNIFSAIDDSTSVDEAAMELIIEERGYRLVYVPGSIVYNHGPETVRDFMEQRRRIYSGHVRLRAEHGYSVATVDARKLLQPIVDHLRDSPGDLPTLAITASLEIASRAWAIFDLNVRGRRSTVWKPISTSKKAIVLPTDEAPESNKSTG